MVKTISNNMDHNEEEIEGFSSLTEEELTELTEEIEDISSSISERTKKNDFNTLNTILSEYLDSFIIIGYNANGDEIVFNRITTPRDARSIASLLEEVSLSTFTEYDDD